MAETVSAGSIFCFGLGFSALALARILKSHGWHVTGTIRNEASRAAFQHWGFACLHFDDVKAVSAALAGHDHLLVSIPPSDAGDLVLNIYRDALIASRASLRWIAYLSTTGVYGDRGGGWVDETSEPAPTTERGRRRLAAEQGWLSLYRDHNLPVHLFRLAGIYGPGRNQLLAVRNGQARRIIKPGQLFSRIHVDDLAGVLQASIARPNPGRCYNVCDDEPTPPEAVVAFAAEILGAPLPPAIPYEQAGLTGLAKSFYLESKRVSNRRMKEELGCRLVYPTYREGLRALMSSL